LRQYAYPKTAAANSTTTRTAAIIPHGVDLRWIVLPRVLRAALLLLPLAIVRPDLGIGDREPSPGTGLAVAQSRSGA
jgi:hypothetical protein